MEETREESEAVADASEERRLNMERVASLESMVAVIGMLNGIMSALGSDSWETTVHKRYSLSPSHWALAF